MNFPEGLKYTKEHEWAQIIKNGGQKARVGITDYAQDQLGDVVYVELPKVGGFVKKMEPFGVVESVKAVSDLFAPVSGKVLEINESLTKTPEKVNKDPYGEGWMIVVEMVDAEEAKDLLDPDQYKAFVEEEAKK